MSYTFICTLDHEWYCKITTLEQLLNPIYQDVTLKQVEEILNEK